MKFASQRKVQLLCIICQWEQVATCHQIPHGFLSEPLQWQMFGAIPNKARWTKLFSGQSPTLCSLRISFTCLETIWNCPYCSDYYCYCYILIYDCHWFHGGAVFLEAPFVRELPCKSRVARQHCYFLPFAIFPSQVSDSADPLVFAAVSKLYTRTLIHSGMPEHMITISQNGILGVQNWLPFSKDRAHPFTFDLDPSLSSNR